MLGTLERLALGAEASEPRQPSNASGNVRKRRAAKFKRRRVRRTGQNPQLLQQPGRANGSLGAFAMSADRRRLNRCTAAGVARFLAVLALVK
jgi:hypothetical protein